MKVGDKVRKIKNGEIVKISDKYKEQIYKVYPKLESKLKDMFSSALRNER